MDDQDDGPKVALKKEPKSPKPAPGAPFQKGDPRAGRPKGCQNKSTAEIRGIARELVEDPDYRERLQVRLNSGKLAPAVECMLWYYVYGKPKEMVELTGKDGAPLSGPQIILTMPTNGRDVKVVPPTDEGDEDLNDEPTDEGE